MAQRRFSLEEKLNKIIRIESAAKSGTPIQAACKDFGISLAHYTNWKNSTSKCWVCKEELANPFQAKDHYASSHPDLSTGFVYIPRNV